MNKLYYISLAFLLFFIPSEVFAPDIIDFMEIGAYPDPDDTRLMQVFQEIELVTVKDSPYTMNFVAITKDNNNQLVSVIDGIVYAYLPHQILVDYLDKFPSNYITKDGIDYKKWSVWILRNYDEEKMINGQEFMVDWCTWLIKNVDSRGNFLSLEEGFACKPGEDNIVIMRVNHASIVVDENDTTDYYMTVLKRLN